MRDFNLPGRSLAVAEHGMAATSHPLATLAALEVLKAGGNAMDAALAAVAVQGVVEPAMTGIGGDCFCLYAKGGGLPVALNGSGRAPAAASAEWFADRGITPEPTSPHAVTVPGAVDAWVRLNADHGSKPLDELLRPAIRLPKRVIASPRVSRRTRRATVPASRPIRTRGQRSCPAAPRPPSATASACRPWPRR